MLIKLDVVAQDRDDRCIHRLSDIPGHERRTQPLLGLRRAQVEHSQRLLVRRGRTHLGEVKRFAQKRITNWKVAESVVGPRFSEKLGYGGGVERLAAVHTLAVDSDSDGDSGSLVAVGGFARSVPPGSAARVLLRGE